MTRKRVRSEEVDWAQLRQRLAALDVAPAADVLAARARQVLAQRAAALALVKTEQQIATGELLVFRLGAERCAIETRFVVEVQRVPELTRLPGAPPHALGVTNLRGEIMAVFDLRPLRTAAVEAPTTTARLLVLGERAPELAVYVDAVDGIVQLDLSMLLGESDREAWGAYARAASPDALVVLDALALLGEHGLFVSEPVEKNQPEMSV